MKYVCLELYTSSFFDIFCTLISFLYYIWGMLGESGYIKLAKETLL